MGPVFFVAFDRSLPGHNLDEFENGRGARLSVFEEFLVDLFSIDVLQVAAKGTRLVHSIYAAHPRN